MIVESGDCVTGGRAGGVVAGVAFRGMAVVAGRDGVVVTAGMFRSVTINVAEAVTSIVTPETFTIYSSGLNVEVSTKKDHVLYPFVPGMTVTVPLDPENPLPCTFCVGPKEDE